MSLRTVFQPELSHYATSKRPLFEGWYCKMVTPRGEMLAVIPGYFKGKDSSEDHAFIQIYDTIRNKSAFIRYPAAAYRASSQDLEVEIAGTRFSSRGISLDIDAFDDQGVRWNLTGTVTFSQLRPWPRSLLSPNAMGWYSFVPFMECNHAVLSFDHTLQGIITDKLTDNIYDFSGGRGYIEKDWGSSFPSEYLWLQGNQFARTPGASIFLSIATIPWLGSTFPGYIGGLWLGDGRHEFHIFAKYNGSSILTLRADEKNVLVVLHRRNHIMRISAHRDRAVPLSAPYHGSMQTKILESAGTAVEVELFALPASVPSRAILDDKRLFERLCEIRTPHAAAQASGTELELRGTELMFRDTTTAACLETVGDLCRLSTRR